MVQAILDGRKTQTRRIIKPQPSAYCSEFIAVESHYLATHDNDMTCDPGTWKPKYQVGDVLYVRETWQITDFLHPSDELYGYIYKASENGKDWESFSENWNWRPSIHMPKEAARIFLKVTDVKAERLQDISEADAIAEGCPSGGSWPTAPSIQFSHLWMDINGPESWNQNPWVWAYTFERCERPDSSLITHNS